MENGVHRTEITDEQRRRMEENRQKALKLRAAKQFKQQQQQQQQNSSEPSVKIAISSEPLVSLQTTQSSRITKLLKGACRIISRTRFVVYVDYHKELIDIFKTVPRCNYDPKERKWNFPLEEQGTLIKAIKVLKSEVVITPLPHTLLKIFMDAKPQREINSNVDLSVIDDALIDDLYPFQREGVCFGIGKQGRILLADDMGLGKTIQAIAICAYYRNEWPLLVIAPSSVRYAWHQSFLKWMPSINPQSIVVVNTGKDEVNTQCVLIISYELVAKNRTLILSMNFRVIIVDESHFLKSHTASRTQAILPLLKAAKRVCLLSGTPALSRPSELFTQVSAICPKIFPSFMEFGMRYCDAKMTPFGYDYSGASNMGELQLVLEETLMIRRLKSDVLSQLPAKRREMIILDPSLINSDSKMMKSFAGAMHDDKLKGMEKRGALLQYFCKSGLIKIKAIKNYLTDLLETTRKFLCFAHHRDVLDKICEMLDQKNYKYIRIDGKTNSSEKNRLCETFQIDDTYRVAVLSITAANMGITLTAAHLVVFAELFWNPGILTQAEDRAHRIGQADSVLVQYLVAKNTADDYLGPLVTKKLDVLNKAGLSKDNFRNTDTSLANSSQQTHNINTITEEDLSLLESFDWDDCSVDANGLPAKKMKK